MTSFRAVLLYYFIIIHYEKQGFGYHTPQSEIDYWQKICYHNFKTRESEYAAVENYLQMNLSKREIDAISNLGLAHMGDGVYEILCRSYLCGKGRLTVKRLHKESVALVNAPTQAAYADKLLPHLTEQEKDWFRRGKNAHSHAAPKAATAQEYAKATGLETLFGALWLSGQQERLNALFEKMMEAYYGL